VIWAEDDFLWRDIFVHWLTHKKWGINWECFYVCFLLVSVGGP
jgi:hypothetical protein